MSNHLILGAAAILIVGAVVFLYFGNNLGSLNFLSDFKFGGSNYQYSITNTTTSETKTPTKTSTASKTTSSTATTASTVTATVQPPFQSISFEGDDSGVYPSELAVAKGALVNITFKTRFNGTYFGGLDWKSKYFDTGKVSSGESKTVSLIVNESFTVTAYWPAQDAVKGTATVNVS